MRSACDVVHASVCVCYSCVCVWQVSCGGALPSPERGGDRAAGRGRRVCPQEEGRRLVQRHPAEDGADRPVSQQLRRELLNGRKWTREQKTVLVTKTHTHTRTSTHKGWTDIAFQESHNFRLKTDTATGKLLWSSECIFEKFWPEKSVKNL